MESTVFAWLYNEAIMIMFVKLNARATRTQHLDLASPKWTLNKNDSPEV